ncbi:uncharacterized protein LOC131175874 [Hevea brasiliensis]|uniref:uncharacterized protein LOC131175874 n=1 Tax=Hevea brasiliensis TaxID=3981 RepID=UPI0025D4C54A|nr:uncharacterized protein LOC131175874 [Hevea brasiliensis]
MDSSSELPRSGMLSRGQLLLFERFFQLSSQPVFLIICKEKKLQEAVAVTIAIQEAVILETGIGESLAVCGEMACAEAELGPDEFNQQNLQEQDMWTWGYKRIGFILWELNLEK